MARIDKVGRIVIPKEYRKIIGIGLDEDVDMLLSGGEVIIRSQKTTCRLCRKAIEEATTVPLCDACIELVRNYKK